MLPNGKNYQIEKLENRFIFTKRKKWRNFLYFSTYLTSFPRSGKNFTFAIYTFFYMRILFTRITRLKIVKKLRIPKNHGKAQLCDRKLRKSHLNPPSRVGLIHKGMFSIYNRRSSLILYIMQLGKI